MTEREQKMFKKENALMISEIVESILVQMVGVFNVFLLFLVIQKVKKLDGMRARKWNG